MDRRGFFVAAAAGSATACLLPKLSAAGGPLTTISNSGCTTAPYDSVNARLAEAKRDYAKLGHIVGSPQFERDVNATLLGTVLCH